MPTKKPTPKNVTNEIGQTGTVIYNGQVASSDYNPDLRGATALASYEKMRKGDGTVKAMLRAIKLPILSAKLRVEPASDSAEDKEVAEWVDAQIEGMTRPFSDTMREGLSSLDFGHWVFETVYRLDPDGRIGLKKLGSRLPSTIYAWETEEGQPGITQMTFDGNKVSIPIERLVILTNEKEGDNWEGESILRAAYKPWKIKETLEKIDAIAHERQGLGVPYAKPTNKVTDTERNNALQRMRNLRANEEDGLYIPPGWEYGFLDMGANTTRDPMKSIEYHRFEMMLSIMASFLLLGSTDSGSRALSTDLSDFFEMAVKYVAAQQLATYNEYLVKRLVDLNFNVTAYPKLDLDGLGSFDYAKVTEALSKMASAGVLTKTLDIEQSLRKAMGLQEAPEDSFYPDPAEEPAPPPMLDPTQTGDQDKDKKPPALSSNREQFLRAFSSNMAESIQLSLFENKGG